MKPPITEGIWKWYVHIPTGRRYHGADAEDIVWYIKTSYHGRNIEIGSLDDVLSSCIPEEFVELYDV